MPPTILANSTFPPLLSATVGRRAGNVAPPNLARATRANTGSTRLRTEVGQATVEEMAEWTRGQISYPNLASVEEDGERKIANRALDYVLEVKRHYLDVTSRVRSEAILLLKQLRGNSLLRMGRLPIIHSPEIHKRIERIVPRLEEAMFSEDPPFQVRGRRAELDKGEAQTILAFMLWQLDAADFDELIQPAIRDMLIWRFAMIYVWWDRRFDWRVIRQVERQVVDGRVEYRDQRKQARVLTFDGPRLALIDPTNAIIDPRFILERDMEYIGHEASMTKTDLLLQQELGWIENAADVQALRGEAAIFQEQEKLERSLTPSAVSRTARPSRSPELVRVTTLFGRWDLYDDGVEREVMIVVANDNTVLRVSENPYDDKIRPYACAVAAKDQHEFFSVGPMTHALQLNQAYDRLRTIGFRAAEMSMAPVFTSEDGEEAPDTLYDIVPGTRIPGGKLSQIQIVSNLLDNLVPWANMLREDIDEATGAPPIFAGNDESDTATQAVGNLREANKRMRGYLRAQARMWTRVLEMMHALNRQFVVGEVPFAVLGKMAARLGQHYANVNPTTFLPEVSFDFIAMQGLYNPATRATAMLQWLNAFAPFLAVLPGVNISQIAKRVWDQMVSGPDDDGVVRVTPMLDELVPQSEENIALLQGVEVPVDPNDPDEEHLAELLPQIRALAQRARSGERIDPKIILEHVKHLEAHIANAARKTNAQAAAAGFVDPSPPNRGQVPGMENRTENPQGNAGMDAGSVAQTPRMETPGPGSAQQTPKPGRRAGAPQETNQQ